jgi:hypothetical protein
MKSQFTVGIILKPYVRKYILNRFGDPADLYSKEGEALKIRMIEMLKKPCLRNEKRINEENMGIETRFCISESDFYRHGWEISKTDMIRFNRFIENEIKFYSRCYIAFEKSFGVPIATSIRNFQHEFEFTEEDFPYETIKKDFDRNGQYIKFDKFSVFKKNLRDIFLEQLSEIRHIA